MNSKALLHASLLFNTRLQPPKKPIGSWTNSTQVILKPQTKSIAVRSIQFALGLFKLSIVEDECQKFASKVKNP